jgi:predicted O-linked N-acetylglucosamine transferase (SPINDLY family)
MPELIVASPTQYEDSAVQFATHPLELARLKQRLESNRLAAPLFDTPLLTKHMEAGYRMIYERYHADLPPAHVSV